jgi:acyl-CoA synthetase (AMP-forming)/AMP-acid ligase II
VKAVIVAKDPAAPPSTDELRAHARARLAPFKVPGVIELITALPRNAGGKVLRRQLV